MTQAAKANLDADYLGAGFGRALPFGKRPALLIVDFVRAYLEPGSPLYAKVVSEAEMLRHLHHADAGAAAT